MNRKEEYKTFLWILGFFLFAYFMPLTNPVFKEALLSAFELIKWYAQEHVLLCLVPAFFIAGVIAVFVGQEAVIFSVVIGLTMNFIYRKEEAAKAEAQLTIPEPEKSRSLWQTSFHFFVIVFILVFANWSKPDTSSGLWYHLYDYKWMITAFFGLLFSFSLIYILKLNKWHVLSGMALTTATLTEVPILQGLITNGMGKGPALSLLLAGPAISLPNMLVIRGVIGTQKTVVYVTLVVIMATASGFIYGAFF
jgi:uncharacterized membrane protein YraQ (UPF0718 family)